MAREMFWLKVPICVSLTLLLLAIPAAWRGWHGFLRCLPPLPKEGEGGCTREEGGGLPFQEVLLGLLIVLATLYLARWCIAGAGRDSVAAALGYFAAILTNCGGFQRLRNAFRERLGGEGAARRASGFLVLFCAANALGLMAAFTLALPWLLPQS